MPFLTQGKTNWKFLLIVFILAVIAGGGILAYQYWWLPKQLTKLPEITIKNETAGWQTYRNENQGFEIKIPSNEWTKDIRINDKNPKRFDGWFSLNSAEENDTLRIKIDLFSELTPILPEQSFVTGTTTFELFKGEIGEEIIYTQDDKETSISSRFCLNQDSNLENSKPDFNASEATEHCSQNYDLYDFNLYCKGRDSKNCELLFNQILSTFKFLD